MNNSDEHVHLVQYALLQTTVVPSLICDLYLFVYFIRHWRKAVVAAPQNHAILCLLIVSVIQKSADAPFLLHFLRWGRVFRETDTFCMVWSMWSYSLGCMILHVLTWCCLERHLFIFHNPMMKRQWCLIAWHYIPLLILLIYAPIFYSAVIFWLRLCANSWNYSQILCGSLCYLQVPFWGTFDWLFNHTAPVSIIILANLLLLVRIIWQNIRQQRQKRMFIQLVAISTLYIVLLTPQVIIVGVLRGVQYNDVQYVSYYVHQLLPFVIASTLPKMQKNLKRWVGHLKQLCCRGARVHPP